MYINFGLVIVNIWGHSWAEIICYLTLLNSCYILFDYVIALFLKQEYSLYLFSLIILPRQQLLFLNIIKVWNMLFFFGGLILCV